MTLVEELRQPSTIHSFHPLKANSAGLGVLQRRLKDLKELKIQNQQKYIDLLEETLKSSRDLLSGDPIGLATDIFLCESCAAKFCTFYSAVLGIKADRDFIKEVLAPEDI